MSTITEPTGEPISSAPTKIPAAQAARAPQIATTATNYPLPRSPHTLPLTEWPARFAGKLTTSEDALKVIKSGQRIYIGGGCGEPIVLAQGLVRRAPELRDVEIIHILTAGHAAYADPGLS